MHTAGVSSLFGVGVGDKVRERVELRVKKACVRNYEMMCNVYLVGYCR